MDSAITGALIGTCGTAALAILAAAGRDFVSGVGRKRKAEAPAALVVGVTHSELRAVMAEFQIVLRDELLDPMRKDIAEVHGCIDGAREDMQQLRHDVRHDVANQLMVVTGAVESLRSDLTESVRNTELFRIALDKRLDGLKDDGNRQMRSAGGG